MDDDDDIPDTRVFVSGLPPNLTSDQLGAHFAARYQITDAVIVPGRQIGFVGFRNYTLAKSAVKYFDKTYIRMSKISAEIARPVEISRDANTQAAPVSQKQARQHAATQQPQTSGSNPSGSSQSTQSSFQPYQPLLATSKSTKRKRVEADEQKVETDGSKDYVDVMQSGSSRATWTNEDAAAVEDWGLKTPAQEPKTKVKKAKTNAERTTDDVQADEGCAKVVKEASKQKKEKKDTKVDGESVKQADDTNDVDLSSEQVKKMKKKEKKEKSKSTKDSVEEGAGLTAEPDVPAEMKLDKKKRKKEKEASKGGVDSPNHETSRPGELQADQIQHVIKNDNEWLRSRTNRTLDLVDDSDQIRALEQSQQPQREPRSTDEVSSFESEAGQEPDPKEQLHSPTFLRPVPTCVPNGRLFVRNLPYSATDADLNHAFARYGRLEEVHVAQDTRTNTSKGMAYVQFAETKDAERALQALDGSSFQGRLLHILPALDKKTSKLDDFEMSKLPLKRQKELKRKREAEGASFSWNSLYMNPDAVIASVAQRLGVDKSEILDPASSDAAVKQAHAETHVIHETKKYLSSNGINVDAFKAPKRDKCTLLIKNFSYGVSNDDLKQLFEPYGQIQRLVLPPAGTMAIVQYSETGEAALALRQLAYKNYKGSVLFLEKAPAGLFDRPIPKPDSQGVAATQNSDHMMQATAESEEALSSTVFVRNLNFSTTSDRLKEVFQPLAGFVSGRVKTKLDPKRPGEILSMGYGFVDFRSSGEAQAAVTTMNGMKLDTHELVVRMSQKAIDAGKETRRQDIFKKQEATKTKIVIKNLPFEASKKDVRALFSAYGQLRSVRVPKKFDNSTRGFAFAEFITAKEAQNAIDALTNTHLLGRRLVLEFASGEAIDPEEEIRVMEKKINQQVDTIHVNSLTGSARRKFNVNGVEEI